MKKIAYVVAGVALVAVLAGALLAHFSLQSSDTEVSDLVEGTPGYALNGLLMCIAADECNIKSTVEYVQGRRMLGLYQVLPEKGISIKYALQMEAAALTVIVVVDANNQLSITDADLDGVADAVISVADGKSNTFGPLDKDYVVNYVFAQMLYEYALQTGWDKLVPPKTRQHLRDFSEVASPRD